MTKTLQVRIDDELKEEVDKVLNEIGLDTTTAVRIFLKKVVRDQAIPFPVTAKPEDGGGRRIRFNEKGQAVMRKEDLSDFEKELYGFED